MLELDLPLRVRQSAKKDFILNLNNYRNAHFRTLNTVKKNYKDLIWHKLPDTKIRQPVFLEYTLYQGTKRLCDVANPCSVLDKFICDAMVEKGILVDDNYEYVVGSCYWWGGVDKENPRVNVKVKPANERPV